MAGNSSRFYNEDLEIYFDKLSYQIEKIPSSTQVPNLKDISDRSTYSANREIYSYNTQNTRNSTNNLNNLLCNQTKSNHTKGKTFRAFQKDIQGENDVFTQSAQNMKK